MVANDDADPRRSIVTLADAAALGPERAGAKAANLARLAAAGLPVPPAVVVLPEALTEWNAAMSALLDVVTELPGERFAVRSSATAEDTALASYAGQYESVLDVGPAELPGAVRRVFESAAADRVATYRRTQAAGGGLAEPGTGGIAVLVQTMVLAEAAGVAFTADPLTGDRTRVVITAVRGLGERLVAGEAIGDEWIVEGNRVACRRSLEHAIDAGQARALADLARRAEALFGSPQDVEWAAAGGRLFLVQSRPMTALPEQVDWTPPHAGWWLRNFRLGEWLPEPVTPLFSDWLLPVLHDGMAAAMRAEAKLPLRPEHTILHGWCYTTPPPRPADRPLPLELVRHPQALLGLPGVALLLLRPDRAPRALARRTRDWRDGLLPRYRTAVGAGQAVVDQLPPAEAARLVDTVGEIAGEYCWSVATLAGSQWKIEATLARFLRRHLPGVDASAQLLVSGLPGNEPGLPAHAVHSADWYWPTAGETGQPAPGAQVRQRHAGLGTARQTAEARCRAALTGRWRLRRRFDRLLATAQRYAVVREQQTRDFTLGWPLLRRCALRLGEQLQRRHLITSPADVFFLTRAELQTALADRESAPLRDAVARRRAIWERQRRLAAPLQLGTPPALGRRIYAGAMEAMRAGRTRPEGALAGQPASPGRATGRVRIILDPTDFARLEEGEVLVARATTPAWTPLFARAAAVVTDGGTLAAHASLIAREYGIPAVVATGDATRRLRDRQLVTVDGNTGAVEIEGPRPTSPEGPPTRA